MLPRMKVRTEIGEEVTEQQPHQARLAIEIGEQPTLRSKIVLPVLEQQVCGVAKHDIMEAHHSREHREREQGPESDMGPVAHREKQRSEERRVGQESVGTCRSRWAADG